MPAIDAARRLLFAPVDVGCVRQDGDARDVAMATLGRSGERAAAFLRFDAIIPPEATVLEAYLLLERATDVDMDSTPVALHAARVVSPWDGRSLSWARQPHVEEIGSPVTRVVPASGPLVRLDVRELVQRWRRRGREEFGVAVLADTESVTGVVLALTAADAPSERDPGFAEPGSTAPFSSLFDVHVRSGAGVARPRAQFVGPRLEVYVR
jgi:hypothetical protein